MDMVSPAVQLASKIPDKQLQVWAATLLAGRGGWCDVEICIRVE